MFKRRVNEIEISLEIGTQTPILIKAGDSGADPTQPDMEFVRTYHGGLETVYLPGSSLKGALRAHGERIARTLADIGAGVGSCDPLQKPCQRPDDTAPDVSYRNSCFICRIFGNTSVASHFSIHDAYPVTPPVMEERNGVAIDRIYGSVAVGPFNYQVATSATFTTHIRMFNYSLAQVGLIALVVRDFDRQMVSLGFGKSRGLGQVSMKVKDVTIRYPGCELDGGVRVLGTGRKFDVSQIAGAGALFKEAASYGYPLDDLAEVGATSEGDAYGLGVEQRFDGEGAISLWRECVKRWKHGLEVPA